MKNKRRIISLLAVTAVVFVIFAAVKVFGKDAEYVPEIDEAKVKQAFNLLNDSLQQDTVLYIDYLQSHDMISGEGSSDALPESGTAYNGYDGEVALLDYQQSENYKLIVQKEGFYNLKLDYVPIGATLSNFGIDIKINGEQAYRDMRNIALPLYWTDATKDFPTHRYGDETAPYQNRKEEFTSLYLYNNTYQTKAPLLFWLKEGENIVTITNISSDGLGIGRLRAEMPEKEKLTYEQYHSQFSGNLVDQMIRVNSVNYIEKNSTEAIYSSVDNPVLTPHEIEFKRLNTMSWKSAGTEITYEIPIEQDGFYKLAFHYRNEKEEFSVFQTIKIDGEVPFAEMSGYEFKTTGSSWGNEVLKSAEGKAYEFYLTKGTHTLTLRSEQEPVARAWRYARLISEHVTQFDLDIKKITGSDKDKYRTWKMTKYIPEVSDYLEAYETLLQYIRYTLQDYTPNGVNSAILADLDKAAAFIEKMKKYPDEIALHTQDLTGNDNSILVSMGNFTTAISKQSFALDMIYAYGSGELPKANSSVLGSLGNGVAKLINSFTTQKYTAKNEKDVLNIWVNRAVTHVDLLQKMVDTEFTPKTGIKVKISVMPDANKLTMAAAANETPDIALGLASNFPFELACRGALYDMTKFEDFWTVANRFVPGAFSSYLYNEGIYALPETLDFHAVIYRKDIFDSIGLAPPDTWQEVIDMLPHLQRLGMNFYHEISSGIGYKWFFQTSPLIYQNNGELYSDDGLRTAIDEPNAVKGLQQLGDLFIAYSLDPQVNSFFNSFRYSILPVGIIDLANYILIKNGAPELQEQWELANYPGTVQEDGSISRWYIANGTSGIIFEDTKMPDQAWEFLKWWTAHDTQVSYSYTLQSTYGAEFIWLSSNIEAVKDSPIEQKDKLVILDQLEWMRDVPRTPGQYLLERSISDIWNTMVFDGTSAQVAVDEKTLAINREIKKKMKELGFYDNDGNLLKPYVIRDLDWITEQIENAKEVK